MKTCEYPECDQDAVCTVHAQWTVVDFVDYEACELHEAPMHLVLRHRRVDGALPVDLWTSWYSKL